MMKHRRYLNTKRVLAACLSALISFSALNFSSFDSFVLANGEEEATDSLLAEMPAALLAEPGSYEAYLASHQFDGTFSNETIEVEIENYRSDDDMSVSVSEHGLETGDVGTLEWTIQVPESGFYNVNVSYFTIEGTRSNPSRSLLLNGETAYPEMAQLLFRRSWFDTEIGFADDGVNEVRPLTNELPHSESIYLMDQERRYQDPLILFLEEGEHTLTLVSIKEPLGISGISFGKAADTVSYEAYRKQYPDAPEYQGDVLIGQAERVDGITKRVVKNSPSIIVNMNYSDPSLSPSHPYYMIYNTIGAESWQQPGDAVTWDIEVENDGWYYLSFKGRQHINRGVTSYRRLTVNGVVPYREAAHIAFDFSGDMTWYSPLYQDEPARIYLQAGVNQISLETVLGEMGSVVTEIQGSLQRLNGIYLRTIQLTGQVPDTYIDYEVARKIPDFSTVMREEATRLNAVVETLVRLTGEKGENTSIIDKMAVQAAQLAEDPEDVTEQIGQLKNNISALATYLVNVLQSPLEVDALYLSGDSNDLPQATSGWLARMVNNAQRFFATFFVDRTSLMTDNESTDPLTVWMVTGSSTIAGSLSSGREQAQILRTMINDTYTPSNGQAVNLELIPTDVVLRSALAGIGPDVIVGLGQETLADFAMRSALKALDDYPEFIDESAKFSPASINAASYQGQHYGMPEQQTFMTLFYREDILQELGLEIPETWDDVRAMIPVLQMHNYDFYLPNVSSNFYNTLVLQYGGDIYSGEGLDYGISSGLYSTEALTAFRDYTNFFTSYKLQVQVDFANRFRTGEMPIGIAEYSLFNQLEVFAPEIRGKWSFAPLPGMRQDDGEIDRTYVANTVQSGIMEQTDQADGAWSFLKWWTSTESQVRYANTLESIMGSAARYFPASEEALRQLPWSNSELNVLTTQMGHTVGIPAIPGQYMNTRMVQYAFYAVVDDAQNAREALYLNLNEIDEELSKKRAEFGLDYIDYSVKEGELVKRDE